jgi:hypothetical protein
VADNQKEKIHSGRIIKHHPAELDMKIRLKHLLSTSDMKASAPA